ncbi:holin family protein [Planktotalea sp.]|uniref:holin family protein n=1 Tax=Planktotalea sp. TaxID=2029877 RepID=UPI003D6A0705
MGLIDRLFGMVFGNGGNLVAQTAEVFRENAEKSAVREVAMRSDALAQYAQEFALQRRGLFDRLMDAVNRLPRPAMALGTLGLFAAAMIDPIWFAARMQGIALVPEPLWWLLGAIVSFYFGARHQLKNQQFQKQVAASLAITPTVMRNLEALNAMKPVSGQKQAKRVEPALTKPELSFPQNAALQDWAQSQH